MEDEGCRAATLVSSLWDRKGDRSDLDYAERDIHSPVLKYKLKESIDYKSDFLKNKSSWLNAGWER